MPRGSAICLPDGLISSCPRLPSGSTAWYVYRPQVDTNLRIYTQRVSASVCRTAPKRAFAQLRSRRRRATLQSGLQWFRCFFAMSTEERLLHFRIGRDKGSCWPVFGPLRRRICSRRPRAFPHRRTGFPAVFHSSDPSVLRRYLHSPAAISTEQKPVLPDRLCVWPGTRPPPAQGRAMPHGRYDRK